MTAAPPALVAVLTDLEAEGDSLDTVVAADGVDLSTPTPAPGWTVAHQLGHLAWTDGLTILACHDPAGFAAVAAGFSTPDGLAAAIEAGAAAGAAGHPAALLDRWRFGRSGVLKALAGVPPGTRIAWIGPPMGAGTMASARLMETWAHGQDIADAFGVQRPVTDRIRHVADLGVRTRDHAFRTHGLPIPGRPFRVELTGPSGAVWTWGPLDAEQQVTGPAVDFALLVTRRRHPDDLALHASGALARQWLTIAQAFAGPPGPGRPSTSG